MTTWEEALTNCHKAYLEKGGNSNAKVKNAHMWIKKKLGDVLGNDYTIFSLDNEKSKSKEIPIEGSLYTKKVDVAILKEQSPKGVVSFKYVASNYSQNTNNYFENLIGECYNIQSMGIPFCHVLVMRNNMPYFEDSSNVKNNETITSVKINKYLELLNQDNSACPKKISINIININWK